MRLSALLKGTSAIDGGAGMDKRGIQIYTSLDLWMGSQFVSTIRVSSDLNWS